jgi:glutathione S-transferase
MKVEAIRAVELIGLAYSPWTEKARWALDYCRVPYRYQEHVILLGMPALVLKSWGEKERTVPMLRVSTSSGRRILMDSFEIAKWADRYRAENHPEIASLFPDGLLAEIKHFNVLSEMMLEATRALVMDRTLKSEQAQIDALPQWIPGVFRRPMRWLAPIAVRYLDGEFSVSSKTPREYSNYLFQGLLSLRSAIEKFERESAQLALNPSPQGESGVNGRRGLLGPWSYADMIAAVSVQGVLPVDDRYIRLKPSIRATWTADELARNFETVLKWRDEVYLQWRHGC